MTNINFELLETYCKKIVGCYDSEIISGLAFNVLLNEDTEDLKEEYVGISRTH